ncbi:hypothetical protein [Desulfopila sp. IMCC35008]|uniref:hypothetical protein n=1 Tax=Desulfopila sp. IMCC35008 TaxID=2653858 RepID=UPI0013D1F1FC|nr:hypothetical protein [Desulfopila sp. IMCC35008]
MKKIKYLGFMVVLILVTTADLYGAPFSERWANPKLYGVLFNNYDPNFYTGFVPRVQNKNNVTIHLGRGNQVRIRMVLTDEGINSYIEDQVARHALYKEVIDKKLITLTTNRSWESYDAKVQKEQLAELADRKPGLAPDKWRQLNLDAIDRLNPGRLHHITRDFNRMAADFASSLRTAEPTADLREKLVLINSFFPHRIYLTDLTTEQDSAFGELLSLAKADDTEAFTTKAQVFFTDITSNLYAINGGKLDFYEFTTIYPAGTYDKITTYKGHTMPLFTTTGVWNLIPREHGSGDTGMVDYISDKGYYGLMPMLPYQYAGGTAYNAFHNPGISNWMAGHPLIPEAWKKSTENSRNGKPYLRASVTSRGPVSHGCTRMNPGHLTEFREMLPSTSDAMQGIRAFMNKSQCYDIIDVDGDGTEEAMGVQYYIAFQGKSRVASLIWAQNNRRDFYDWLYGDEIVYGEPGEVTVKEAVSCDFVGKKAVEGRVYDNIGLYEAPYEPEFLQFYTINGIKNTSSEGYEINRELRRVGYGYEIDRKLLKLD